MNRVAILGVAVVLCQSHVYAQADAARPAVQINTTVTVTGCVMREADYRTQHATGTSGSAVGATMSNEYVLANAVPSRADARGRRGGGPGDLVTGRPLEDTGGRARTGRNYTLDGPLERSLGAEMNHVVQIVGKVQADANSTSNGAVETLPRITIETVTPLGDICD